MQQVSSKTIFIATTNPGKLSECKSYLSALPYTLVSPHEIKLPTHLQDIEETGDTFAANARIKANALGRYTKLITIADDSGLVVDALDGRPGVYSHRYGINDADRIQKILLEMKDVPMELRTARFVCTIALYDPGEKSTSLTEFTGVVEGFITFKPHGTNGFGYDPIFFCPEINQTFAESSEKEKNRVSHRGRALVKVETYLRTKLA